MEAYIIKKMTNNNAINDGKGDVLFLKKWVEKLTLCRIGKHIGIINTIYYNWG